MKTDGTLIRQSEYKTNALFIDRFVRSRNDLSQSIKKALIFARDELISSNEKCFLQNALLQMCLTEILNTPTILLRASNVKKLLMVYLT